MADITASVSESARLSDSPTVVRAETRVSALTVEVGVQSIAPQAISQLTVEVGTQKIATQAISQLVIEVSCPTKRTPFRIAAHYSGVGRFQSADGEGTLIVVR